MERLLLRARALPQLGVLSDHQLQALLAHSDPQPEAVSPNVILFQRGEFISCWYLLLSGQVQLYLDQIRHLSIRLSQLKLVGPGIFFGELRICADATHCCSAKVVQTADFVRIDHRHFMALYNKWAEQLQDCMVPMEDLVSEAEQSQEVSPPLLRVTHGDKKFHQLAEDSRRGESERPNAKKRTPTAKGRRERHSPNKQQMPNEMLLFKLDFNHSTIHDQTTCAALQLKEAISGTDTRPISGVDLCGRLRDLCAQWLPDFRQPFSALMLQGICQMLLDRFLLVHVRTDHPLFRESASSLYRWLPSSRSVSACPPMPFSLLLLCLFAADSLFHHILQKLSNHRTAEELEFVFEELSHIRAFSHFSRSMKRGLSRMVCWECHEHAGTVIFREGDPGQSWFVVLRGTLEAKSSRKEYSLLQEGDDFGKLALLNNCDDDKQQQWHHQQNNQHSSNNRAQRQTTVITAEDGCQLLRVDATKFNRLLCEMETNTVRLKEYLECGEANDQLNFNGKGAWDVLVLQKDTEGRHSLIAGLPSKILEYTLETRVDHFAKVSPADPCADCLASVRQQCDSLLPDVVLSLPLWMPSNEVCNVLKLYYCFGISNSVEQRQQTVDDPNELTRIATTATKRRTVAFVRAWQATIGHRFFLDSVANAFVEELFSCVLEDARTVEDSNDGLELAQMVRQMESLMALREEFMRRLSRHPRVVLDKGMYTDRAPAPEPVLPSDLCIQTVHLFNNCDSEPKHSVTLRLRIDKSAAEIAHMAALTACQSQHFVDEFSAPNGDDQHQKRRATTEKEEELAADEFVLIAMRTGGGQADIRHFEPKECSVPTMMTRMEANQLFVAHRDDIFRPCRLMEPLLPSARPLCLLISPDRIANAMALHHFKLLAATSTSELLVQVVGRDHFAPALAPSNLDLLLRRFHIVQSWASTELLLASSEDRLPILQTLIELAELALQQKDLLSLFAITLGLSHFPVARLHSLWAQLPDIYRHQHLRSQFLLAPSRNHRNYRLLAQQLRPPFVPFVPVIVKELCFVHEGRNSHFGDGLINFEKMHLIAKVMHSFRWAKGELCRREMEEMGPIECTITRLTMGQARTDEALIRNLHAVEDKRRLMQLSLAIKPQQQQESDQNFGSVSNNRCRQE